MELRIGVTFQCLHQSRKAACLPQWLLHPLASLHMSTVSGRRPRTKQNTVDGAYKGIFLQRSQMEGKGGGVNKLEPFNKSFSKEADFKSMLMIMIKLQIRLKLSSSVTSGGGLWSKSQSKTEMATFFILVKSRTWSWLCSLCGENWGTATIKLHEEHFRGSWTHSLRGGGSRVYRQGKTPVNIPGRGCQESPQAACLDLSSRISGHC